MFIVALCFLGRNTIKDQIEKMQEKQKQHSKQQQSE